MSVSISEKDKDYVGEHPSNRSMSWRPTSRTSGMSETQRMFDQHFGPDKLLRDAVNRTLAKKVLPFHRQEIPRVGEKYVCWDCNVGGLIPFNAHSSNCPKGLIAIGAANNPLAHMRVHNSRQKRHKGKQLKLMDMTGHQGLPIKDKIPLLEQMADSMVENMGEQAAEAGPSNSSVMSPKAKELAEAKAKHASLARDLEIARLKEESAAMEEELAAKRATEPTQQSTAGSS